MKTVQGFAFACEQQGGANMVDEQGHQMPPVIMIGRTIFMDIGNNAPGDFLIDSVFYGKNATGFSVGEPLKVIQEEVLKRLMKSGIKTENVIWLPLSIHFAENPDEQRSKFPMPVKILFTASGKQSQIIIKEEFWIKGPLLP